MECTVSVKNKGFELGYISSDTISLIRERTDIISVISEYVHLLSSGRTYKALCPFHKEKTPSFHVSPDKQIYHCYGCGKGGDVFSFLMEMEHLTFPEAVRFLAAKSGIEIPKDYDPEAEKREDLFNVLVSVFAHEMHHALDFLQPRQGALGPQIERIDDKIYVEHKDDEKAYSESATEISSYEIEHELLNQLKNMRFE